MNLRDRTRPSDNATAKASVVEWPDGNEEFIARYNLRPAVRFDIARASAADHPLQLVEQNDADRNRTRRGLDGMEPRGIGREQDGNADQSPEPAVTGTRMQPASTSESSAARQRLLRRMIVLSGAKSVDFARAIVIVQPRETYEADRAADSLPRPIPREGQFTGVISATSDQAEPARTGVNLSAIQGYFLDQRLTNRKNIRRLV